MNKVIVKSILGCLIVFSGFGIIAYIYLKGISENNLWILGIAAILLVIGILFLNRALTDVVTAKDSAIESNSNDIEEYKSDGKNALERNNELVAEWKQTSDARDRLKLLEAAGNAEEGK